MPGWSRTHVATRLRSQKLKRRSFALERSVKTSLIAFQLPTSILSDQWLLLLVGAQRRHLWGVASWWYASEERTFFAAEYL
jgi:hypothetical protein